MASSCVSPILYITLQALPHAVPNAYSYIQPGINLSTMAYETEHKFLVKDLSFKEMSCRQLEIRQGYLNRNPERTVRVRTIKEFPSGENSAFLTVKGKNFGDTRLEFEYAVPFVDGLEMQGLCEKGILEKTRWIVEYKGNIWEVDEFHGRNEGLVMAEVEAAEDEFKDTIPPFIGEEVTGNPRYYNSML